MKLFRFIQRPLDLAAGAAVVLVTCLQGCIRWRVAHDHRKLMVIDAAYSYDQLAMRDQMTAITNRDLDGMFEHVWTVHPLVGASPEHASSKFDGLRLLEVNDRHSLIEGHVSSSLLLARSWPVLGFALAQRQLVLHLLRTVRNERIGMVQVGDPYYLGLLGLCLRWAVHARLAIRVSGNYDAIYEEIGRPAYPRLLRSRRLEKILERAVFRRSDLILAVNHDNLKYALDNGARRERSAVVPYTNVLHPIHFTDPLRRSPPPTDAKLDNRPVVAMLSRLELVKHPGDVIEAMVLVVEHYPDARAMLIGDGSLREMLEMQARKAGVNVEFVGARDQEWIARVLPVVDVIVSPLTGRALVEAALSATPIVAYDAEWQSEIIANKRTGLLVPNRNREALGLAILELLNDPETGKAYGLACRGAVIAEMNPDRVRDRERELYSGVLN